MRTYNFKDDQVTDHRLGKTWQGVANVMKGSSALDQIILSLDELSKAQYLKEILDAEDCKASYTNSNV